MNFQFRPMTQGEAEEIAGWQYEEPYSFYNMDVDPDDYEEFLDPVRRGSRYYSVYTEDGLMGFFSFTPQEQETVEIGLGMAPGCTGKGQGAAFNQRAIQVYEKAGFVQTETFVQQTNGGSYDFIRMIRKENRATPL